MDSLPPGVEISALPGPTRGISPCLYVRDETVWSPSREAFALAYTIAEASMNNEIGCILWGKLVAGTSQIRGNPEGVYAVCWSSPWAAWLGEEVFVFKAHYSDGRHLHLPLVAIHLQQGFHVLPKTNNTDSRPSDMTSPPSTFTRLSATALADAIRRCV